jgi:hypothetical protein
MNKRQIIFDQDEQEGLMYDLEKANEEGLWEEMYVSLIVNGTAIPLSLSEEHFQAVREALDLGVNVPPNDRQFVALAIAYEYHYGRFQKEEVKA